MSAGQTLHNGIRLSRPWPPQTGELTREPLATPPYLQKPPAVIPIDTGRQLFVDDFLIEETTLKRTYHLAEYQPANPVLKPDKPWETKTESGGQPAPTAMVFSDGVWYDPQDHLFKLWYMAGYCDGTAYATSKDGVHWEKPTLDGVAGTNLVHISRRDSGTVWLDQEETDAARRYKLFLYDSRGGMSIHFSPDGIHWTEAGRTGPTGDRSTVHYDAFRKVWVYNIREYLPKTVGRCRRYWENPDVLAGAKWAAGEPPMWVGADEADPRRDDLKTPCELYNLDCVSYESLTLGLFTIWRGQPKDRAKPNEVCLGYSRDGFHWYRPDRRAFVPVSEKPGDWNWGNVQSAGGCCLVVGDKLYFYVSGRTGVPGKGTTGSGTSSTGLAILRRDGFASMAAGNTAGTLTTRPGRFTGDHLFVNAVVKGELCAEVIGGDGKVVEPFTRANCKPIRGDSTIKQVQWKGANDLSSLPHKTVKFRFHLTDGQLYSFWVSPEASGASHGYVAAGGPGFTGPTDTVGRQTESAQATSR